MDGLFLATQVVFKQHSLFLDGRGSQSTENIIISPEKPEKPKKHKYNIVYSYSITTTHTYIHTLFSQHIRVLYKYESSSFSNIYYLYYRFFQDKYSTGQRGRREAQPPQKDPVLFFQIGGASSIFGQKETRTPPPASLAARWRGGKRSSIIEIQKDEEESQARSQVTTEMCLIRQHTLLLMCRSVSSPLIFLCPQS